MKAQYFTDVACVISKVPSRGGLSSPVSTYVTFMKIA
jgi:hypothetical protein